MATAPPRFIITEKRPISFRRKLLWLLLWLASLFAAWWAGTRFAWPDLSFLAPAPTMQSPSSDGPARDEDGRVLQSENEDLRQKIITLERAGQVDREAARTLQAALVERDAELAALRNDVAFYERLAGGDAQRQPLAVHSLDFRPAGDGSWRYVMTLTQNLKKAVVTKGDFSFSIEGTRDGKLQTLSWGDLRQKKGAPAQAFSFKYFQQVEGSIALPEAFTPHRVRVFLKSDQGKTEQVLSWNDETSQGAS